MWPWVVWRSLVFTSYLFLLTIFFLIFRRLGYGLRLWRSLVYDNIYLAHYFQPNPSQYNLVNRKHHSSLSPKLPSPTLPSAVLPSVVQPRRKLLKPCVVLSRGTSNPCRQNRVSSSAPHWCSSRISICSANKHSKRCTSRYPGTTAA